MRSIIGNITHGDSPFLACLKINMVVANGARTEKFKFGKSGNILFCELAIDKYGKHLGIFTGFDKRIAFERMIDDGSRRKTLLHECLILGIDLKELDVCHSIVLYAFLVAIDRREHRRKSIRMKDFDYTTDARWFVTICTHERKC